MSTEDASYRTDRLAWYKSSYSGTSGGDCVEVAVAPGTVHVRDSKTAGDGPVLRVGRAEWAAFVARATK